MTIDDFKKEKIAYMKAKDSIAVSALNVVINKLMLATIDKRAKGEELGDADVVSILQKTEKELLEERDAFFKAGRNDTVENLDKQIKVIKKYLPKLLSREEIKEIILALPDKAVPFVMKHFKSEYAGKVDMKVVSEVLRSL